MGDAAVRWAQGYPVDSPRARAVLVALAELSDDQHTVVGRSQGEIAARSGQSVRTVASYLAALEGVGVIRRKVHQRVEGRGRVPDLYFLAVDVLAAETREEDQAPYRYDQSANRIDQSATNRQPIGNFHDQSATNRQPIGNFRAAPDYAFDFEVQSQNQQTPPTPPTIATGRWAPQVRPLDALPGPTVCDDFERSRNHPECRRVAGLVVDAASRRAEFPLTPTERKKSWGTALELLQVGHAPEAIAQAIADAPTRTFPAISLELNRARTAGPRSVGASNLDAARRWIAGW